MTLQKLSHHAELQKRLIASVELLTSLEAVGAQSLDDPSRDWAAAAIADAQEEIARAKAEIAHSESMIDAFISTVGDLQTRTIFCLRFLGGLAWGEVAAAVGGGNTDAGVRMICYRYLKAHAGNEVERQ